MICDNESIKQPANCIFNSNRPRVTMFQVLQQMNHQKHGISDFAIVSTLSKNEHGLALI